HRPQLAAADVRLAAGVDGFLEEAVQRPLRRAPQRGAVDGGQLRGPGVLARVPALERGQRVVGQAVRRDAGEAVDLRRVGEGGGERGDVVVRQAADLGAGGVLPGGCGGGRRRGGGLLGRAGGEEAEGDGGGGAGHGAGG